MTPLTPVVLIASEETSFTAALEGALLQDRVASQRMRKSEALDASTHVPQNATLLVFQVADPRVRGHELRDFHRHLTEDLRRLLQLMPRRPQILIVMDCRAVAHRDARSASWLESTMVRFRARAAPERGCVVMIDALVLTGAVDDQTVARRICEAARAWSLPDTDFLVLDEDIRAHSLAWAIQEQSG